MNDRHRNMMMLRLMLAVLVGSSLTSPARGEGIAVKSGQKIAFMGDSITAQGAASASGYVKLVVSGLEANGVKVSYVGAGISGHKSDQMLERLDRDVVSKKPDWMTLSCGVNDVWHGAKGVPLDSYKKNITAIVDKCQSAGIKVMILTSTMIGEDAPNDNNKKLAAYNDFLRELAKERKLPLADLNADMQEALKVSYGGTPHKGNVLTVDGVHMNVWGNQMMAGGVLRGFGLNDEQLKKAHEFWLDIPNAADVNVKMTLRQYEALSKAAEKQGKSVQEWINTELAKGAEK